MAKATGPGKHTVTKQVYVYKEPGKIFAAPSSRATP
jgi:hypothetical protein